MRKTPSIFEGRNKKAYGKVAQGAVGDDDVVGARWCGGTWGWSVWIRIGKVGEQ